METVVVMWFYAWGALTCALLVAMVFGLGIDAVRCWTRRDK